jgi:hypothetical protein
VSGLSDEDLARGICAGMRYLHDLDIIHRFTYSLYLSLFSISISNLSCGVAVL